MKSSLVIVIERKSGYIWYSIQPYPFATNSNLFYKWNFRYGRGSHVNLKKLKPRIKPPSKAKFKKKWCVHIGANDFSSIGFIKHDSSSKTRKIIIIISFAKWKIQDEVLSFNEFSFFISCVFFLLWFYVVTIFYIIAHTFFCFLFILTSDFIV